MTVITRVCVCGGGGGGGGEWFGDCNQTLLFIITVVYWDLILNNRTCIKIHPVYNEKTSFWVKNRFFFFCFFFFFLNFPFFLESFGLALLVPLTLL